MMALLLLLITAPVIDISMAEDRVIQHQVVAGETLMTISNIYYNTHQCWQLIKLANLGLIDESAKVTKGQVLAIPGISQCQHPRAQQPVNEAPSTKKKITKIDQQVRPVNAIKAFAPVWKQGEMLKDMGPRQQIALDESPPPVTIMKKKKKTEDPSNLNLFTMAAIASKMKKLPVAHRQGSLQLMQKNSENPEFYIQLKSVKDKNQAKEACQQYRQQIGAEFVCHLDLFTNAKKEIYWRVQWGPFSNRQKAHEKLGQMKNKHKIVDAFVVNLKN